MRSLVECAMRAIMGNVDAVDSLGELPFRLAKPILMVMTAEKLVEIETNSPHLKEDDQEIWENLCLQRFGIRKDSEDFEPPKSWRKFYHVSLARLKQMEDDAGLRARNKYAAIAAEKQERSLVFNPNATPMKRARTNGWGRGAAPKTLFDKARSDARRKAAVIHTPSSKSYTAPSSSAANLLFQAPTRPIIVSTHIRPQPKTRVIVTSPPPPPLPRGQPSSFEISPPPSPQTAAPRSTFTNTPDNVAEPIPVLPARLPMKRPRGADALFMPKHAYTASRVPSRAR